MEKRTLGADGLEVSPSAWAAWASAMVTGQPSEGRRNRPDPSGRHRGVTFFDTAQIYGEANEEMVGEALEPYATTW